MLQEMIIPTLDLNGKENRRSFENAFKHKIGSGPFSKLMYLKISTTKNFQSLPTLKKRSKILSTTLEKHLSPQSSRKNNA
jgi:hypothetical protein